MSKRPRSSFGSSQERTRPNDSGTIVAIRQPSLAIHVVCLCRGATHIRAAEEPCADTLLALAGGVDQVSDSLGPAGQRGQQDRLADGRSCRAAGAAGDPANRAAVCSIASACLRSARLGGDAADRAGAAIGGLACRLRVPAFALVGAV